MTASPDCLAWNPTLHPEGYLTMNLTASRLSLAAAAVFASMGLATAQTPDPHHAGAPAVAIPTVPSLAGTPMPSAGGPMASPPMASPPMASPPMASPMGGEMGRMMEMMRPMMAGGMGMPFEHVEGRIAYLKAELKITDAQAAPWNAFADTMRVDAIAMKAMHEGMGKAPMPTTTPDRMTARRKMMSEHMAMMDRSEASMKALYATLSTEQRTTFDQLMSGPMGMM